MSAVRPSRGPFCRRPVPATQALAVIALIGAPGGVLAQPLPGLGAPMPTLQQVVAAEGWTPTPAQSGIYAPGVVLVPNGAGAHEVVANDCVAEAPRSSALSQSSIATTLQAGVVVPFARRRIGVQAELTKKLTFVDPEQRTIPLGLLVPSEACRAEVARAGQLRDLRQAIVVHDVLVAIVKNTICGRLGATGLLAALPAGEAAAERECVQESDGQIPIGFKSVPLALVLDARPAPAPPPPAPLLTAAPAPPAAVPSRALESIEPRPPSPAGRVVGPMGYALRPVPPGRFTLGCTAPSPEGCGADDPRPLTVELPTGLLIGETEVTQGLYSQLMGSNPSTFADCGPSCPVEEVSWFDALAFANALSAAEGLELCYEIDGEAVRWVNGRRCLGYRLPLEAEWEIAARAGGDGPYAGGAVVGRVAWTEADSGDRTHPVGQRAPNAYGLHDLSGNVWEWVWDAAESSPGAPRVSRGGSWDSTADSARVWSRGSDAAGYQDDHLGFRLARSVE